MKLALRTLVSFARWRCARWRVGFWRLIGISSSRWLPVAINAFNKHGGHAVGIVRRVKRELMLESGILLRSLI